MWYDVVILIGISWLRNKLFLVIHTSSYVVFTLGVSNLKLLKISLSLSLSLSISLSLSLSLGRDREGGGVRLKHLDSIYIVIIIRILKQSEGGMGEKEAHTKLTQVALTDFCQEY